MLSILIAAIEGRRLVSIWYDPGVRVVEPHALGYGSDGQVLLKNLYLSLDPYMRGAMNEKRAYGRPLQIGDVMLGETISQVMDKRYETMLKGE